MITFSRNQFAWGTTLAFVAGCMITLGLALTLRPIYPTDDSFVLVGVADKPTRSLMSLSLMGGARSRDGLKIDLNKTHWFGESFSNGTLTVTWRIKEK